MRPVSFACFIVVSVATLAYYILTQLSTSADPDDVLMTAFFVMLIVAIAAVAVFTFRQSTFGSAQSIVSDGMLVSLEKLFAVASLVSAWLFFSGLIFQGLGAVFFRDQSFASAAFVPLSVWSVPFILFVRHFIGKGRHRYGWFSEVADDLGSVPQASVFCAIGATWSMSFNFGVRFLLL